MTACASEETRLLDLEATWTIEIVDGYEETHGDACPEEGTGPLGELLLGDCGDTPAWDESEDEVLGWCTDPLYPQLPDPPENPNPDSYKLRVRLVAACEHPDFADEAGCASSDEAELAAAEETVFVEYRDGLYPILPQVNYCPLLARWAE